MPSTVTTTPGIMAYGADVSWLSQLESRGVRWVDSRGQVTDCLLLLKERGVNAIRLRVMVNPERTGFVAADGQGHESLLGFCGPEGLLAMAERCQRLNFRLFVDFHLSDTWADPAHQTVPAAWRGLGLAGLEGRVAEHVSDVLTRLARRGITPEWVQLGNEIPRGVLWGDAASGHVEGDQGWSSLARLLNAGYDAAKRVVPSVKVVIHIDRGFHEALFRDWFDHYRAAGGRWDVVGLSFYPYWQPEGTVDQLQSNMNALVERYGTPVMVCEVGGLASDPQGTRDLLRRVKRAVASVSKGQGLGLFYWEPESSPDCLPDGYRLGASLSVEGSPLRLAFSTALDQWGSVKEVNGETV